jgi:type I restriction enzyme S subunit
MGEIAQVVGGGTPKTSDPENFEGGSIAWLTPADLSGYSEKYVSHGSRFITEKGLGSSSARLLPEGAVMFTSRAPIGYAAIARNPIATNQGFKSFVLKPGVLPDYVYWWLKGAKQLAESMASGTTFLELSGAKAKQLPIPIAPIEDQRCIVAEIEKQFSRLDEAVANLKRVKANLKRYKAAVLKAAVEGRLVPTEAELARPEGRSYETGAQLLQRILETRRSQWHGKRKYKEPAKPGAIDQLALPVGWCWVSVEAVAFVTKLAGFEYTKYVEYSAEGDLAVIKAENAGRYGFKRTKFSRIKSNTVTELTRSQLRPGDLLMVFVGAGTGNVARVPDDQPYFLGPNIAMIRIESGEVLPEYLECFLRSSLGNSLALGFAKAVAQPSLSMGTIRLIPVAVPPLLEQRRIITELDRCLSIVGEVDAEVDTDLKRAERLRQSVLADAYFAEAASG